MAIQFSLPNIVGDNPLKSSVPDYMSAIRQGMELGYLPRSHANSEYAKELANKINEGKAKYAMQQALADLQNTQATTSHLGAQTRGLNIENQFLPEKLRLAEQIQRVKAKYAEDREENEIAQLLAGNRLTNEQATELGIKNETLPEKLKLALQLQRFKANNPLLYASGIAQQIGALDYLRRQEALNNAVQAPSPINMDLTTGHRARNEPQPMEMEVNEGRRTPLPKPSRIRESQIPAIGRKFVNNEEVQLPYEQLSKSVAQAFNNPNESRIPSIGRFFEEPRNSDLNKIPLIMSMMAGMQPHPSELGQIPAIMPMIGGLQQQPGMGGLQQQPGLQGRPQGQIAPQNMSLADLMQQSIISSLQPKGAKGGLSPIGKSIQERQQVQQGLYPGTNIPIDDPARQATMLQNYDDQIRSQSIGKNGSAKDAEKIQLEKDKLRVQIEKEKRLAKQANLSPSQKAEYEAVAKENVKQRFAYQKEIPEAYHELSRINKAIKIAKTHPNWFGPVEQKPFATYYSGPKYREQTINDPDYGILKSTLENLVGPKAKELSGSNKVLATSLNLAGNIKPTVAENQNIALGKLFKVRHEMLNSINEATVNYKDVGGKRNYFVPKTKFIDIQDYDNYMAKLTPIQRQLVKNRVLSKDRP